MSDNSNIIFSEIANGYSPIIFPFYGKIYTKHFTSLDSCYIDIKYKEYLYIATSRGVMMEKDRLKQMIDGGEWSKQEEQEIAQLNHFIKNAKEMRSTRAFTERDRKNYDKQIRDQEIKLEEILYRKNSILGLTAEKFASKKSGEFGVYTSFYKDRSLTEKFFNEESFAELETSQISQIIHHYNQHFDIFNTQNFKKVALSPIFCNSFYLCNDDPFIYFGKPVIQLTFYQLDIFSYAKYFKSILSQSENKPPPMIAEDPDKLIEWYETTTNANKVLEKNNQGDVGASFLMGASQNDLNSINGSDGGIDLIQEAIKKGGSLDAMDMMKLHGYKDK